MDPEINYSNQAEKLRKEKEDLFNMLDQQSNVLTNIRKLESEP